jgi:PAS domain S-box-containing protein
MSGIDEQHLSDRPHMPEAGPHGFWYAARESLFGIVGLTLITVAVVGFHAQRPVESGVGPGTISLLYLIVIVFVSLRGGFAPSVAVSLIASFCLIYFVLPLEPSLRVKNPLDIVATVAFLLAAFVITGIVARLRERNALLDGLFEQAPAAIALIYLDTRVIRVNRAFTRMFGYTPQETAGRALSELIVPDELQHEFQSHLELMARRQRAEAETIRRRKDGSRLDVLAVGAPVALPRGQIAVYAMYSDITERKAAEKALRTLSRRLMEVQEDERRHLARELHDEIGQLLTSVRLLLKLNGDSPEGALNARFEQARAIVDDLLGRVRALSFDLRPADLDELGLLPALLALFERYTAQTGVLVKFKHQGVEGRFSSQLETGAYRIVQEALTNAARHAGVTTVNVRVWTDPEKLNLQIEDRGSGFEPEVVLKAPQSSGLAGMRERTVLLGGRLTIESFPGSGTTIIAELPLDKTAS